MTTGATSDVLTTLFRAFRSSHDRARPDVAAAITTVAAPEGPASRPTGGAVLPAAEAGAAVVFDKVSLAFDEQVVLDDVSFEIPPGAMRILLGSSGAVEIGPAQADSRAAPSGCRRVYVHGQRVDTIVERDLLRVRADIGMLFQENARSIR